MSDALIVVAGENQTPRLGVQCDEVLAAMRKHFPELMAPMLETMASVAKTVAAISGATCTSARSRLSRPPMSWSTSRARWRVADFSELPALGQASAKSLPIPTIWAPCPANSTAVLLMRGCTKHHNWPREKPRF